MWFNMLKAKINSKGKIEKDTKKMRIRRIVGWFKLTNNTKYRAPRGTARTSRYDNSNYQVIKMSHKCI